MGVVKTMCNTPPPFSRATSPSLVVCLSGLLKTNRINSGIQCRRCIKIAIVDEYLLEVTCWLCRPTTRDTQIPLYHTSVKMSFITHTATKILKNATCFAYNCIGQCHRALIVPLLGTERSIITSKLRQRPDHRLLSVINQSWLFRQLFHAVGASCLDR